MGPRLLRMISGLDSSAPRSEGLSGPTSLVPIPMRVTNLKESNDPRRATQSLMRSYENTDVKLDSHKSEVKSFSTKDSTKNIPTFTKNDNLSESSKLSLPQDTPATKLTDELVEPRSEAISHNSIDLRPREKMLRSEISSDSPKQEQSLHIDQGINDARPTQRVNFRNPPPKKMELNESPILSIEPVPSIKQTPSQPVKHASYIDAPEERVPQERRAPDEIDSQLPELVSLAKNHNVQRPLSTEKPNQAKIAEKISAPKAKINLPSKYTNKDISPKEETNIARQVELLRPKPTSKQTHAPVNNYRNSLRPTQQKSIYSPQTKRRVPPNISVEIGNLTIVSKSSPKKTKAPITRRQSRSHSIPFAGRGGR